MSKTFLQRGKKNPKQNSNKKTQLVLNRDLDLKEVGHIPTSSGGVAVFCRLRILVVTFLLLNLFLCLFTVSLWF